MKERPILFSAPMVRAILSGSKTQTRRIMKPQPDGNPKHFSIMPGGVVIPTYRETKDHIEVGPAITNRFGQPGDRLWVRETWNAWSVYEVDSGVFEAGWPYMKIPKQKPSNACVLYAADAADDGGRWRPSIHMPRWASRINLEIVSIRVERLQEISEEDAITEGIERTQASAGLFVNYSGTPGLTGGVPALVSYKSLWESINGLGSWELNPFVWVIELKRITP